MPKTLTWILVADGARARILERNGPTAPLRAATDRDFANPQLPTREIGTDRPGRQRQIADGRRSAMEPRVDWHEFEKVQFAREMAKRLNDAAKARRFARLILVAPPKTLGELRQALDAHARERIVAELDKDLTQVDLDELPRHLEGLPWS